MTLSVNYFRRPFVRKISSAAAMTSQQTPKTHIHILGNETRSVQKTKLGEYII